jgi:hypothetical protein
MKKWSNLSLLAILLTGLFLYNCKKKEADPLEPDSGLVDEIGKIDLPEIELEAPAPVTSTPAEVKISPAAAALATGITSLTPGGPIPEAISGAAADVSAALSESEISALSSIDNSVIDAVSAGGELPAALQAVVEKVSADPKLKAFLPTFTLPTVNGLPVSGRTGNKAGTDHVLDFNDVAVSDECLEKANEEFALAKSRLDASRDTKLQGVAAAYSAAIAPLAANETSCTAALTTTYASAMDAALAIGSAANASLEAVRSTLGDELFKTLQALTNISFLAHLNALNSAKAADSTLCTQITAVATQAAQDARDTNTQKVESAYQTALSEATDLRSKLLSSCHNQGGGN